MHHSRVAINAVPALMAGPPAMALRDSFAASLVVICAIEVGRSFAAGIFAAASRGMTLVRLLAAEKI
jgi:hypothetical protein